MYVVHEDAGAVNVEGVQYEADEGGVFDLPFNLGQSLLSFPGWREANAEETAAYLERHPAEDLAPEDVTEGSGETTEDGDPDGGTGEADEADETGTGDPEEGDEDPESDQKPVRRRRRRPAE